MAIATTVKIELHKDSDMSSYAYKEIQKLLTTMDLDDISLTEKLEIMSKIVAIVDREGWTIDGITLGKLTTGD
jgi:hypothetical protein